jgi:ATP-dependent DNA helicase RecG
MRYSPLDPVRLIPGIGEKIGVSLEYMGIQKLADLLHWFPRRYLDATVVHDIKTVPFGQLVALRGTVLNVETRPTKNRRLRMLEVEIGDETGELLVRYFNQPYLATKFVVGSEWIFIGSVKYFGGKAVMASPQLEKEPRIIPIYAQTKGVSSKMLTNYLDITLKNVDLSEEVVPAELVKAEELEDRAAALKGIHQPESQDDLIEARKYLSFEEAFRFFLSMMQVKGEASQEAGVALSVDMNWFKEVIAGLPFELTDGQKRVTWDALKEMESGKPMTRLLNGDVGSGKTVVAALLAVAMAKQGFKTAVLVPTEILAKQHAISFEKLVGEQARVGIWTAAQKDNLDELDIVIGTHALLQEGVDLGNLGLVVIDEQHRFGVRQRSLLRKNQKTVPHVLSMTATPIPRTLALVLFVDLTVSFLKEKPKNRLPISTEIIFPNQRLAVHERIVNELAKGHQVFVLCPLIEAKEEEESLGGPTLFDFAEKQAAEKKTVLAEVERLKKEHPEYGIIEAIHGKMKAAEKREIMARMAAGEINVLVATSVIEVGVDVPNATVMVIEGAEHFGLAQLHQFRGRVGRDKDQAYCFLCTESRSQKVSERLDVLVESDSGFDVAERDLDLRGPGDLTGLVQSGLPDFHFTGLTNIEYLQHVKEVTEQFVAKHPEFLTTRASFDYSNIEGSLE